MRSTGIIRRIDELGRIVIPKEMRNVLNIANGDPVEIVSRGEEVVITKYQATCLFCGSADRVVEFKCKKICVDCLDEIKKETV